MSNINDVIKDDYSWLETYADMFKDKYVLELGCGPGIDSVVVSKFTKRLVSSDIEPISDAVTAIDHSKVLPFKNETFDTVVASLCLHYFSLEKTKEITSEISRVLKPHGALICRLNSHKDKNHGAVGYPEIEPGFYNVEGETKRFFNEQQIQEIWEREFTVGVVSHKSIDRYQKAKFVYEFTAIKL